MELWEKQYEDWRRDLAKRVKGGVISEGAEKAFRRVFKDAFEYGWKGGFTAGFGDGRARGDFAGYGRGRGDGVAMGRDGVLRRVQAMLRDGLARIRGAGRCAVCGQLCFDGATECSRDECTGVVRAI